MLGCLTPLNRQQVRTALEITEQDDPTDTDDFNPLDPYATEIVEQARANIAERFLADTTANWIAKLDATGAPASQVNLPEDMIDDPQVQAIGAIAEIEHPLTGPERMVGPVYRMSDSPAEVRGPSPIFDADTDDILAEHGYGEFEIGALRAIGAVGLPDQPD